MKEGFLLGKKPGLCGFHRLPGKVKPGLIDIVDNGKQGVPLPGAHRGHKPMLPHEPAEKACEVIFSKNEPFVVHGCTFSSRTAHTLYSGQWA
jgi:hypothetical protein